MTTSRNIPLVPTGIVLVAVAAMVTLGFWQLQRKEWKEALIARFERSQSLSSAVPWPADAAEREAALYRHSSFECVRVVDVASNAGRSATGRLGWSHEARCITGGGGEAMVALGWSSDPRPHAWRGGQVAGFIAPAGDSIKLVAAPPQAGLEQLAAPDPREIPNNHLAYAVQWFFFAATALVIYGLALRRRGRDRRD